MVRNEDTNNANANYTNTSIHFFLLIKQINLISQSIVLKTETTNHLPIILLHQKTQ